ncbi:heavy-metal-associated domain-containing protein [Lacticaseibacillus yichunensis]|uniref:Copper chaperone CopZ n=1 Tax=Lacticaseibacillus yichunensis TaxID=2486015 RepID=A0ABW4CN23_9LACO|nr:heavy-metal-associated domain-containing protein [Lacticaseibacillus yichunensis]
MTKKLTLQLDELTCPSCLTKIETAVKNQPGVETVKVLFNAGKVKAQFDDSQIAADQLTQVVSDLGYEVKSSKVTEA